MSKFITFFLLIALFLSGCATTRTGAVNVANEKEKKNKPLSGVDIFISERLGRVERGDAK